MKDTKPWPDSPAAWLLELAEAYWDGRKAVPCGKMTGDEFNEESLIGKKTIERYIDRILPTCYNM